MFQKSATIYLYCLGKINKLACDHSKSAFNYLFGEILLRRAKINDDYHKNCLLFQDKYNSQIYCLFGLLASDRAFKPFVFGYAYKKVLKQ